MNKARLPSSIPISFQKFFWDVDATTLVPGKNQLYIINRLLDKGDIEAARWVLKHFSKETIKETFRKRRDFSPWNGRFWAYYLNIPQKEVACLQPSYLAMRRQLWPY